MAKWSPFRKIRFWVIYDPAKKQIGAPAKYKYQLAVPSRGSGKVIVEMTGFYPASARETRSETMNKKAIREHVEACPLGWWQGTVRTARKTTDADIIAWLAKLRELVGLDTVDGEVEHGS